MASYSEQIRLQFTADTGSARAALQDLSKELNNITSLQFSGSGLKTELNTAISSAKELQKILQNTTNLDTGNLNLSKFVNQLNAAGLSVKQLGTNLAGAGNVGTAAFSSLASAIARSEAPILRLNGIVGQLATSLANTIKWQISSSAIHAVISGFSSAVGYAKDLNTSLNNIRIVTGQSVDDMARFAKQANEAAKALSTTTNAYAQASLIYYQQGDSVEQAAQKAAITIKAANASFSTSAAEMSEYLTAVWNSYQVGAEELEKYVDIMAALGAKTATSLEEIATSMQKVAATANTVGVSMEQVSSIIATVSSVTRESAESIGTSFKTIFARIGDLKLGESLGDGVSFGQVSAQLDKIGVSVLDATGNLRDMGDIITDLGNKWQILAEGEKAAVAQVVAGKRQYTQLMALFENWDMYKSNLNIANTADGELQNQANIYAESWEAASNRVRTSWEGIWKKIFNDEAIIDFTDGLATVIQTLSEAIDAFGGLKGVLMMIGTVAVNVFSKNIANSITQMTTGVLNFANSFSGIQGKMAKVKSFFTESTYTRNARRTVQDAQVGLSASAAAHSANARNTAYSQERRAIEEMHVTEIQKTQELLMLKEKLLIKNNDLTRGQKVEARERIAVLDQELTVLKQMREQYTQYAGQMQNSRSRLMSNAHARAITGESDPATANAQRNALAQAQMGRKGSGFLKIQGSTGMEGLIQQYDYTIQRVQLLKEKADVTRAALEQLQNGGSTGGKATPFQIQLDNYIQKMKALADAAKQTGQTATAQHAEAEANAAEDIKNQMNDADNPITEAQAKMQFEAQLQTESASATEAHSRSLERQNAQYQTLTQTMGVENAVLDEHTVNVEESTRALLRQKSALQQNGDAWKKMSQQQKGEMVGGGLTTVLSTAMSAMTAYTQMLGVFSSETSTAADYITTTISTLLMTVTAAIGAFTFVAAAAEKDIQLGSPLIYALLMGGVVVTAAVASIFAGTSQKQKQREEKVEKENITRVKEEASALRDENTAAQELVATMARLWSEKNKGINVEQELSETAVKLADAYNLTGDAVKNLTKDYNSFVSTINGVDAETVIRWESASNTARSAEEALENFTPQGYKSYSRSYRVGSRESEDILWATEQGYGGLSPAGSGSRSMHTYGFSTEYNERIGAKTASQWVSAAGLDKYFINQNGWMELLLSPSDSAEYKADVYAQLSLLYQSLDDTAKASDFGVYISALLTSMQEAVEAYNLAMEVMSATEVEVATNNWLTVEMPEASTEGLQSFVSNYSTLYNTVKAEIDRKYKEKYNQSDMSQWTEAQRTAYEKALSDAMNQATSVNTSVRGYADSFTAFLTYYHYDVAKATEKWQNMVQSLMNEDGTYQIDLNSIDQEMIKMYEVLGDHPEEWSSYLAMRIARSNLTALQQLQDFLKNVKYDKDMSFSELSQFYDQYQLLVDQIYKLFGIQLLDFIELMGKTPEEIEAYIAYYGDMAKKGEKASADAALVSAGAALAGYYTKNNATGEYEPIISAEQLADAQYVIEHQNDVREDPNGAANWDSVDLSAFIGNILYPEGYSDMWIVNGGYDEANEVFNPYYLELNGGAGYVMGSDGGIYKRSPGGKGNPPVYTQVISPATFALISGQQVSSPEDLPDGMSDDGLEWRDVQFSDQQVLYGPMTDDISGINRATGEWRSSNVILQRPGQEDLQGSAAAEQLDILFKSPDGSEFYTNRNFLLFPGTNVPFPEEWLLQTPGEHDANDFIPYFSITDRAAAGEMLGIEPPDPTAPAYTPEQIAAAQTTIDTAAAGELLMDEYLRAEKEAALYTVNPKESTTQTLTRLTDAIDELPTDLEDFAQTATDFGMSQQALAESTAVTRAQAYIANVVAPSTTNAAFQVPVWTRTTTKDGKEVTETLSQTEYDTRRINGEDMRDWIENKTGGVNWKAYSEAYNAWLEGLEEASDTITAPDIDALNKTKTAIDALTNSYNNFYTTRQLDQTTQNALLALGINPSTIDTVEEYNTQINNLRTSYGNLVGAAGDTEGLFKSIVDIGTAAGLNTVNLQTALTNKTSWDDYVTSLGTNAPDIVNQDWFKELYTGYLQYNTQNTAYGSISTDVLEYKARIAVDTEEAKQNLEELKTTAEKTKTAIDALKDVVGTKGPLNRTQKAKLKQAGVGDTVIDSWGTDPKADARNYVQLYGTNVVNQAAVLAAQRVDLTEKLGETETTVEQKLTAWGQEGGHAITNLGFGGASQQAFDAAMKSANFSAPVVNAITKMREDAIKAGKTLSWSDVLSGLRKQNINLDNQIDLLWAGFEDSAASAVSTILSIERTAAQEVVNIWTTAFKTIAAAREGLANNKSILGSIYQSPDQIASIIQMGLAAGLDINTIKALMVKQRSEWTTEDSEGAPSDVTNWNTITGKATATTIDAAQWAAGQTGSARWYAQTVTGEDGKSTLEIADDRAEQIEWARAYYQAEALNIYNAMTAKDQAAYQAWVNSQEGMTWDATNPMQYLVDYLVEKDFGYTEVTDTNNSTATADYQEDVAAYQGFALNAEMTETMSQFNAAQTRYNAAYQEASQERTDWQAILTAIGLVEKGDSENIFSALVGKVGDKEAAAIMARLGYTESTLNALSREKVEGEIHITTADIQAAETTLETELTTLEGKGIDAEIEDALNAAKINTSTAQGETGAVTVTTTEGKDGKPVTTVTPTDPDQTYKNRFSEMASNWQMSEDALNSYINTLRTMGKITNETTAEETLTIAQAYLRMDRGIQAATTSLDEYQKTIAKGKKGTTEYTNAMEGMRSLYADIFNLDNATVDRLITDDWLATGDNAGLLEKALLGDETARSEITTKLGLQSIDWDNMDTSGLELGDFTSQLNVFNAAATIAENKMKVLNSIDLSSLPEEGTTAYTALSEALTAAGSSMDAFLAASAPERIKLFAAAKNAILDDQIAVQDDIIGLYTDVNGPYKFTNATTAAAAEKAGQLDAFLAWQAAEAKKAELVAQQADNTAQSNTQAAELSFEQAAAKSTAELEKLKEATTDAKAAVTALNGALGKTSPLSFAAMDALKKVLGTNLGDKGKTWGQNIEDDLKLYGQMLGAQALAEVAELEESKPMTDQDETTIAAKAESEADKDIDWAQRSIAELDEALTGLSDKAKTAIKKLWDEAVKEGKKLTWADILAGLRASETDLQGDIDTVWAKFKDSASQALTSVLKMEQETANEVVKIWETAFKTIADARLGIASGKSVLEAVAGDEKKLAAIYQMLYNQNYTKAQADAVLAGTSIDALETANVLTPQEWAAGQTDYAVRYFYDSEGNAAESMADIIANARADLTAKATQLMSDLSEEDKAEMASMGLNTGYSADVVEYTLRGMFGEAYIAPPATTTEGTTSTSGEGTTTDAGDDDGRTIKQNEAYNAARALVDAHAMSVEYQATTNKIKSYQTAYETADKAASAMLKDYEQIADAQLAVEYKPGQTMRDVLGAATYERMIQTYGFVDNNGNLTNANGTAIDVDTLVANAMAAATTANSTYNTSMTDYRGKAEYGSTIADADAAVRDAYAELLGKYGGTQWSADRADAEWDMIAQTYGIERGALDDWVAANNYTHEQANAALRVNRGYSSLMALEDGANHPITILQSADPTGQDYNEALTTMRGIVGDLYGLSETETNKLTANFFVENQGRLMSLITEPPEQSTTAEGDETQPADGGSQRAEAAATLTANLQAAGIDTTNLTAPTGLDNAAAETLRYENTLAGLNSQLTLLETSFTTLDGIDPAKMPEEGTAAYLELEAALQANGKTMQQYSTMTVQQRREELAALKKANLERQKEVLLAKQVAMETRYTGQLNYASEEEAAAAGHAGIYKDYKAILDEIANIDKEKAEIDGETAEGATATYIARSEARLAALKQEREKLTKEAQEYQSAAEAMSGALETGELTAAQKLSLSADQLASWNAASTYAERVAVAAEAANTATQKQMAIQETLNENITAAESAFASIATKEAEINNTYWSTGKFSTADKWKEYAELNNMSAAQLEQILAAHERVSATLTDTDTNETYFTKMKAELAAMGVEGADALALIEAKGQDMIGKIYKGLGEHEVALAKQVAKTWIDTFNQIADARKKLIAGEDIGETLTKDFETYMKLAAAYTGEGTLMGAYKNGTLTKDQLSLLSNTAMINATKSSMGLSGDHTLFTVQDGKYTLKTGASLTAAFGLEEDELENAYDSAEPMIRALLSANNITGDAQEELIKKWRAQDEATLAEINGYAEKTARNIDAFAEGVVDITSAEEAQTAMTAAQDEAQETQDKYDSYADAVASIRQLEDPTSEGIQEILSNANIQEEDFEEAIGMTIEEFAGLEDEQMAETQKSLQEQALAAGRILVSAAEAFYAIVTGAKGENIDYDNDGVVDGIGLGFSADSTWGKAAAEAVAAAKDDLALLEEEYGVNLNTGEENNMTTEVNLAGERMQAIAGMEGLTAGGEGWSAGIVALRDAFEGLDGAQQIIDQLVAGEIDLATATDQLVDSSLLNTKAVKSMSDVNWDSYKQFLLNNKITIDGYETTEDYIKAIEQLRKTLQKATKAGKVYGETFKEANKAEIASAKAAEGLADELTLVRKAAGEHDFFTSFSENAQQLETDMMTMFQNPEVYDAITGFSNIIEENGIDWNTLFETVGAAENAEAAEAEMANLLAGTQLDMETLIAASGGDFGVIYNVLTSVTGHIASGDYDSAAAELQAFFDEAGIDLTVPTFGTGGGTTTGNRSGGGGGGGGGGGDKKPTERKKYSDIERYHEIDETLSAISNELSRIEKLRDRAFGKARVEALEAELDVLKQQYDAQKALQDEANIWENVDREALEELGAKFTEDGRIANWSEIQHQLVDEYNAAVAAADAMTDEDAKKEALDAAKKKYDAAIDNIENYKEAIKKGAEAGLEMEEILNKMSDKQLEIIQYKAEYKIAFNEQELAKLDYYITKFSDDVFKSSESLSWMHKKIEENLAILAESKIAYQSLMQAYEDGKLNEADYQEGLQTEQERMLNTLSALDSLEKEIKSFYGETLNSAVEELTEYTDKLDALVSTMESYVSIQELMGKGVDYDWLGNIYESQYQANAALVQARKEWLDTLIKEKEAAVDPDLIAEYDAQIITANQELLDATEASLETLKSIYDNTIAGIFDKLDKAMAHVADSLTELSEDYAYYQEVQERYVSTAKELYEVSKLNRNIEKSINETASQTNKNLLKALQERINAQSELNDLTQYDLDMNQKQYDLLVAKIALEEAQNAKDTVRLVRDANGNYAYQYTADQAKIDDAEQKYEDALYAIHELSAARIKEIEQTIIEAKQTVYDGLKEIAETEYDSDEEMYEDLLKLSQQYQERMLYSEEEYIKAMEHLGLNSDTFAEVFDVSLADMYGSSPLVNEALASLVDLGLDADFETVLAAIEEIRQANLKREEEAAKITGNAGVSLDQMAESAQNAGNIINSLSGQIDTLVDQLGGELNAINKVADAWEELHGSLSDVILDYESIVTTMQELQIALSETGTGTIIGNADITINTDAMAGTQDTEDQLNPQMPDGTTQYATGGLVDYTGPAWVDGTPSKPELMLNATDTPRFLEAIKIARQINFRHGFGDPSIGQYAHIISDTLENSMAAMYDVMANSYHATDSAFRILSAIKSEPIDQVVTIDAHFPSVTNHTEIEDALNNLINQASHFTNRNF